ncbi:hypothetical protein HMPREF9141_2609 [Prevotella multiformis DSM 16608]|uniref:Uncharacterized protein n=1 Tax=Prevotella multiformis DSM 16608 TaxID=888743 RepID=F0FAJ2_9BACT|nr:hypothetical protein HMPREF9141_2609 [Prevotella multiformis DSM 16608]
MADFLNPQEQLALLIDLNPALDVSGSLAGVSMLRIQEPFSPINSFNPLMNVKTTAVGGVLAFG